MSDHAGSDQDEGPEGNMSPPSSTGTSSGKEASGLRGPTSSGSGPRWPAARQTNVSAQFEYIDLTRLQLLTLTRKSPSRLSGQQSNSRHSHHEPGTTPGTTTPTPSTHSNKRLSDFGIERGGGSSYGFGLPWEEDHDLLMTDINVLTAAEDKKMWADALVKSLQWTTAQRDLRVFFFMIQILHLLKKHVNHQIAAWTPEPDMRVILLSLRPHTLQTLSFLDDSQANIHMLCHKAIINPNASSYRSHIHDDVLRTARQDLYKYSMKGSCTYYNDANAAHNATVKALMSHVLGSARNRIKGILMGKKTSIKTKCVQIFSALKDKGTPTERHLLRFSLLAKLLFDATNELKTEAALKAKKDKASEQQSTDKHASKRARPNNPASTPATTHGDDLPGSDNEDFDGASTKEAWCKVDIALLNIRTGLKSTEVIAKLTELSLQAYAWHEQMNVGTVMDLQYAASLPDTARITPHASEDTGISEYAI
ncbi:hypothetical protein P7C70_g3635, partial [Phenoliferia sp. Uapishka_3]